MDAGEERRKIAVDFDGTIVEDRYPAIGNERPFALRTLRALQERGFTLVLWTCRTGRELDEAVEFCRAGGVSFAGVNEAFEGEAYVGGGSRKLDADIYIDDRNVGGLPSWGEIYQQLTGDGGDGAGPAPRVSSVSKGSLFSRVGRWLVGS